MSAAVHADTLGANAVTGTHGERDGSGLPVFGGFGRLGQTFILITWAALAAALDTWRLRARAPVTSGAGPRVLGGLVVLTAAGAVVLCAFSAPLPAALFAALAAVHIPAARAASGSGARSAERRRLRRCVFRRRPERGDAGAPDRDAGPARQA